MGTGLLGYYQISVWQVKGFYRLVENTAEKSTFLADTFTNIDDYIKYKVQSIIVCH